LVALALGGLGWYFPPLLAGKHFKPKESHCPVDWNIPSQAFGSNQLICKLVVVAAKGIQDCTHTLGQDQDGSGWLLASW